jgi:hypothetical protein
MHAQALATLAAAYCTLAELYIVTVVVGLLFGGHWSLAPAISADLFGAPAQFNKMETATLCAASDSGAAVSG